MQPFALAFLLLVSAKQGAAPSGPVLRAVEPPIAGTTGLVWSHVVFGSDLPDVALGDRGGQVLALTAGDHLSLFSSFDVDPPTPIWFSPGSAMWTGIRAAAESDDYLYCDVRTGSSPSHSAGVLKKFGSGSSFPEWTYPFPAQFMSRPFFDLSRDGGTIVSVFSNTATVSIEVRVHGPETGQPLQVFSQPINYNVTSFDLSPDGSVCAFGYVDGDSQRVEVYEIATGAHLATLPGLVAGDQALSNGGRMLAVFENRNAVEYEVRAYERGPSGYQPIIEEATPLGWFAGDVVVSDDGSTMAAIWCDAFGPDQGVVRAYDLATRTMTMEHVDAGTTQQIIPYDCAIAADGSRFVVGQGGPGSSAFPELAVYSPMSSAPLRAHPEGGAVYVVAMSPDGERYAASRTPGHGIATRTSVELYEFGP
jgi:hypothetical protein